MGVQGHDAFAIPSRVVLAHENGFELGRLHVEPATRQVKSADRRQTLEPRVMQVLIALTRAGGEVVTRDDLIEWCWSGRVVGDDAINRVLSKIRRLAEDLGGASFSVETIPRVGYRIVEQPLSRGAVATDPQQAGLIARRSVIAGTAAVAAAAVAGAVFTWPRARSGAVTPESRDLYIRAVAARQNGWLPENREAIALLREAVRLSPTYGEAWGLLALSYRAALEEEPPEQVPGFEELRREAVLNAERHDPGNGDAAVAMLPFWAFFGRWVEAEQAFTSLARTHSRYAPARFMLGSLFMDVGRWSDAIEQLSAAKALDGTRASTRYKLTVSLWAAGQISRAHDEIDEAVRLWPQQGSTWQTKIKLLALTGRAREALAFSENPASRPLEAAHAPDPDGMRVYLTALASKDPNDVSRSVERDLSTARATQAERVNAALRVVSVGRTELGLDMLEGVYLERGEWRIDRRERKWLSAHPLFQPHARPLWSARRFNGIVDGIGLGRYWRETDTLPDFRRSA